MSWFHDEAVSRGSNNFSLLSSGVSTTSSYIINQTCCVTTNRYSNVKRGRARERRLRCRGDRHRACRVDCRCVSPYCGLGIDGRALAKAGKTVLHLDPNEYYGASQASLTLDELVDWSSKHESTRLDNDKTALFSSASTSSLNPALEANRRRYALSLFPSVLPSRGELIDTLVKSDVSKYVSFRMLDSVSIWNDEAGLGESGDPPASAGGSSGSVTRVPGSKEEVFKDKTASLMEKRRLMKFLMFAAGAFEDDPLLSGTCLTNGQKHLRGNLAR